jgi:polysaccharide transporter, PST family
LRAIIANAGWLGLIQIFNYSIPLIALLIATRAFGPHLFGVLATLNAYGVYVSVFTSYGFELSGPRALASLREEARDLSKTVSAFIAAYFLLGALALACFFVALPLVPLAGEYRLVGLIVLIQAFATSANPQWVYVALENPRACILNQFIFRGLAAVAIILAVRTPDHLLLYVSINCAAAVAILFFSIMGLSQFNIRWMTPSIRELIAIIRGSSQLFVSKAANNLYASTSILVVAHMLGASAAGSFALAERIRFVAGSLIDPIADAIYPLLCRTVGRGETREEANTKRILFRIFVLSAGISLVLFVFAPYIIGILAGPGFEDAVLVLRIVALLPFVTGLSKTLGNQTMLPLRLDRQFAWVMTFAALCGLGMVFLMTSKFALAGAASVTLTIEICITIAFAMVIQRRQNVLSLFLERHPG